MKKTILNAAAIALASALSAWAGGKTGPAPTRLEPVLDAYFAQTAALAEDDRAQAGKLADSLAGILEKAAAPEDSAWERQRRAMLEEAEKMSQAKDLKSMREGFASLSASLAQAVERKGKADRGKIYLMECPMALDNKAAVWLQKEPKVANPYQGRKMRGCGGIKKTF